MAIAIPATYLAVGYSVVMGLGLIFALILATRLHFADITTTHCKTPEYWPSISASTGDFLIPRTVWRLAIAIGLGIRISTSAMMYRHFVSSVVGSASATLIRVMGGCDVMRIICALGWSLIASSENLFVHEISFGIYMLSGFVLQIMQVLLVRRQLAAHSGNPRVALSYKLKRIGLVGQSVCALLVVKFFIDHNSTCAAGSYSRSTMCEWGFAFFNLFFDATQWLELDGQVVVIGASAATAVGAHDAAPVASGTTLLTLAARPSHAMLWYADVFFGYFAVSSLVQLYQNVYFIPMVAMQFTPEVLLVCAALSPILLRSSLLGSVANRAGKQLMLKIGAGSSSSGGAPVSKGIAPPGWVVCYGIALVSYFNFDVTRDSGNKLLMVGVGPVFWFLGFFLRLRTTTFGVPSVPLAPPPAIPVVGAAAPSTSSSTSAVMAAASGANLDETGRLIFSLPLGLVLSSFGRIFFASLDPLHVNAVANAALGLFGGSVAFITLWRSALYPGLHETGVTAGHMIADDGGYHGDDERGTSAAAASAAGGGASGHASVPIGGGGHGPSPAHLNPALCGVLFAGVLTLGLMLISTYNVIPRYLGLDPYPAGLLVPLAFLLGVVMHRGVVYDHSPFFSPLGPWWQKEFVEMAEFEGGRRCHLRAFRRIIGAMLIGFLIMYFGTTQSNRMFEKPGVPETTHLTPLDKVDISQWYVEEMVGSPVFAFVGGLLFVWALGVLMPHALAFVFVATRVNGAHSSFTGRSWYGGFELSFFLTHVLLLMINVYVVCFPFVPGGFLVRDRMWLVLLAPVACICVPLHHLVLRGSAISSADTSSMHSGKKQWGGVAAPFTDMFRVGIAHNPTGVIYVVLAIMATSMLFRSISSTSIVDTANAFETIAPISASSGKVNDDVLNFAKRLYEVEWIERNEIMNPHHEKAWPAEVEFSLRRHRNRVAWLKKTMIAEFDKQHTSSGSPQGSAVMSAAEHIAPISAMIWTIHFGLDNFGVDSVMRLAAKVRATGAGIIGLLETDSLRIFNGNRDVVEHIANAIGYPHTDFGPTTLDSTFGCALITKYRILTVKRYVMPSPAGELACLIHAQLDVGGVAVNTYVGHWGNTDHVQDVKLQSQFLGKLAMQNPGPSIFLGYLTTDPGKGNYRYFVAPYAQSSTIATAGAGGSDVDAAEQRARLHAEEHPFKEQRAAGGSEVVAVSEPRREVYDANAGINGLFRDTAKDLYEGRTWKIHKKFGGFEMAEEKLPAEERSLRLIDHSFRRPPADQTPRIFQFAATNRFSTAHPRFEFVDRYCQYILWKSGAESEEDPTSARAATAASKRGSFSEAFPLRLELLDWWRVLDIEELSDTEIQVAHFALQPNTVAAQPKQQHDGSADATH